MRLSLMYGMNDGLLKKLQAIRNATTRSSIRKFHHITRELHWLPVRNASSTNWRWWFSSACTDWRRNL